MDLNTPTVNPEVLNWIQNGHETIGNACLTQTQNFHVRSRRFLFEAYRMELNTATVSIEILNLIQNGYETFGNTKSCY